MWGSGGRAPEVGLRRPGFERCVSGVVAPGVGEGSGSWALEVARSRSGGMVELCRSVINRLHDNYDR